MLDVVFIMLIFFIVSTSFVKEAGIEVSKPSAKSAKSKKDATIFLAISKEGHIWLDRRKIDVRSVRPNIEKLKSESPKGSVVIQADKLANTGTLITVMDQIRLAGIDNISVANAEGEAR
jgi:biopolymer transport protein ExbD